jgi:hypothetical protein
MLVNCPQWLTLDVEFWFAPPSRCMIANGQNACAPSARSPLGLHRLICVNAAVYPS